MCTLDVLLVPFFCEHEGVLPPSAVLLSRHAVNVNGDDTGWFVFFVPGPQMLHFRAVAADNVKNAWRRSNRMLGVGRGRCRLAFDQKKVNE